MAKPTLLFRFCSLLMAFLFAYSTSVQFNDLDWYFWIPVYSCGCIVNLLNWVIIRSKPIRYLAKATLWLGIFLCLKVVKEVYNENGKCKVAGFLSLDLTERVVREKIGSGLVFSSMILHLIATSPSPNKPSKTKQVFPRTLEFGMCTLVGFGYGLPFLFFVVQKKQMKF